MAERTYLLFTLINKTVNKPMRMVEKATIITNISFPRLFAKGSKRTAIEI